MDAATTVSGAVSAIGPDIFPSGYGILLWAPLLLTICVLVGWLVALIALQRRRQPSSARKASQLENTKTIAKAPIPHGIA